MSAEAREHSGRRRFLRIAAVGGLGVAFGGSALSELVRRARLREVRVTRTQLGTRVSLSVVHRDSDVARAWVEKTFAEIERLEGILSRHRRQTPLARLNRNGVLPDPPPELGTVVERALEWAKFTGGAFDPTVAPLLALYETSAARGTFPSPEAVERVRQGVGWEGISTDTSSIALARQGMSLTLDGIAKGYVVDQAVATLAAAGADRVMVNAGGDLASRGARSGADPWQVGVQDPQNTRGTLGVLRLRGEALATSGDYIHNFTPDRALHHILDPRTGASPLEASGVTVLAPTAMDADALSTAVFVLGPDEGIILLDQVDGVEGLVVTKAGAQRATRGFARYAE